MTVGRAFTQPTVKQSTVDYCLIEISSFNNSSVVVMILVLAWKPLWAEIRLVNSSAMSTLLSSSVSDSVLPSPDVWAAPIIGCPEVLDCANRLFPTLVKSVSAGNRARQSCAMFLVWPLVNTPVTNPLSSIRTFFNEPVEYPFWPKLDTAKLPAT